MSVAPDGAPPLFSADTPLPDPAQGIAAVHVFVTRCRAWAEMEIARRSAAGKPVHEWEAYVRFTDHTLRELENGTLDRWFTAEAPAPAEIADGRSR